MKIRPPLLNRLIYLACIMYTGTLLSMPMTEQATEEVVEVIEEVAFPTIPAPAPIDLQMEAPAPVVPVPTPMEMPTQAPAGIPVSAPMGVPAEQPPAGQPAPPDPAAQPTQMTGPDTVELEKTKPLIEQQNPKIMELFSQAEIVCNNIQDTVKNIEGTRDGLTKQYNQVVEEKNLDLLLQNASHKKGILRQASGK